MTTFASPRGSRSQHTPVANVSLTVEWSLAHNGPATLAVAIAAGDATARLTSQAGESVTLATAGPVRTETIDGLEHIDIPGIASLTIRPAADGSRELLYARTPLLETLGIRGGCVERPRLVTE